MTTAVLRKELHTIIDTMTERSLQAVKPLLSYIADDYWKPVIEPASLEEIAMADKRMKDYEKEPSSFISLKEIK
jgi:isoleucyl-tRNA synthetase